MRKWVQPLNDLTLGATAASNALATSSSSSRIESSTMRTIILSSQPPNEQNNYAKQKQKNRNSIYAVHHSQVKIARSFLKHGDGVQIV